MARPVEERAGVGSPAGADLSGVDVFLSHVEEDKAVALQLADGLEAAGYSTWCYERDTIPGPSYLLQTSRAIEQSRAVLVLISPDSLGSHQVTSEVVRARGGQAVHPAADRDLPRGVRRPPARVA